MRRIPHMSSGTFTFIFHFALAFAPTVLSTKRAETRRRSHAFVRRSSRKRGELRKNSPSRWKQYSLAAEHRPLLARSKRRTCSSDFVKFSIFARCANGALRQTLA